MKDSIRKVFLKLFVIIAISMSIITPVDLIKADDPPSGVDKTNVLTNVEISISQNGIDISEGGTIYSQEPIRVEVSFNVPVFGDNPEPDVYVNKGDTAYFELSDAFSLISGSTIELKTGSIVVAHVSFNTNLSTGMVTAEVVFDGDDQVFDGTSNNVRIRFVANFEFDDSGAPSSGDSYTVVILGKTYTVEVLPMDIIHNLNKTGVVDLAQQQVEWIVNIDKTQGDDHLDMTNYVFKDNLSNVGVYIDNSFTIDGISVTPEYIDNIINYVFSDPTSSPKVIRFKTTIPDSKYYGSGNQTISNTASIFNSDDVLMDDGSASVSFTPQWISKSGVASDAGSGVYDPTNRTITWTITVNQMEASLSNVVINDVLPGNLTFNNAYWETWDGTSWTNTDTITPNGDNDYLLGNIDSRVRLIIVSNVPDEQFTTTITTYQNSARVRWDGIPAIISSGNVSVPVGFVSLTKIGSIDSVNRKMLNWTVTFDGRGQTIDDLKIYDLLIYTSSTGFNIANVTGIPVGLTASDLIPRFDQMYTDSSFSGAGLTLTVHPIYLDGIRIGDLLEISDLSLTNVNTFTFSSEIMNPNIYLKNSSSTISNTASLFSGVSRLVSATRNLNYPNYVLSKELLRRAAISDPAGSVNTQLTTNITEAFDYIDKTAIFRLSINANGIDIPNSIKADGTTLGTVTIKDTLPEGWEFVEIISDQDYLLFEGNQNNSSSVVSATDTTPDSVSGMTYEINGREISFTFTSLDRPYVILVKAKVSDATVGSYFNENKTTTVRNTLGMLATNWTPGISTFRDISIQSSILEKRLDIIEQGVLRWTVDYKPYDVEQIGNRIDDVLPIGLDVRTNSAGLLIIENNIAAYEMNLNANGSYSVADQISLVEGSNVFYNSETRTLSFLIADNSKGYRFTYITDVTGNPGTVSNTVSLIGNNNDQEQTATLYMISASDGEASLLRNGWISIRKTDANSTLLAGAQFTLFALDMTTIIRTAVTNSDGNIRMMVLPDGQYYLKETVAPAGYILDERIHTVSISTVGDTVVSSVNGKTGPGANSLTVINYLQGTVGQLRISKEVAGNAADQSKAFNFTITFDDLNQFEYLGDGVANGQISSGDTISLTHGQSITIIGLPKDITYEVIEYDYRNEGYTTTATNSSGTIIVDETQTVEFTNTKDVGHLRITKQVSGNAADQSKAFNFTITFDNLNQFEYLGDGVANGQISSGDTISLTHGQSITIIGLPKDITYEVIEYDYRNEGYTTTATNSSGTIIVDETQTARFINTRNLTPNTGDDNVNNVAKIGMYAFGGITIILIGLDMLVRKKKKNGNYET